MAFFFQKNDSRVGNQTARPSPFPSLFPLHEPKVHSARLEGLLSRNCISAPMSLGAAPMGQSLPPMTLTEKIVPPPQRPDGTVGPANAEDTYVAALGWNVADELIACTDGRAIFKWEANGSCSQARDDADTALLIDFSYRPRHLTRCPVSDRYHLLERRAFPQVS